MVLFFANGGFFFACFSQQSFYQAAVTYDRANLREQVMQFIENNTAEVLKSSGMAELSAETFFHILQSNNLRATEEELLEAVEKWGAINSAVGHQSLASVVQPVIRGIRFPLLKPETLKRIEQSNITAEIVPVRRKTGIRRPSFACISLVLLTGVSCPAFLN